MQETQILNEEEVSKEILAKIHGAEKVVAHFGFWPSFHDGEILSIYLDRAYKDKKHLVAMIVKMVTFDIRVSPTDPKRNTSLVTFEFKGIDSMSLEGFNHQNVTDGLWVEMKNVPRLKRDLFHVEFGRTFGADAVLECNEIEVASVEAYKEPDLHW